MESDYRPQSPDLSGFQPANQPSSNASYAPRSPVIPAFHGHGHGHAHAHAHAHNSSSLANAPAGEYGSSNQYMPPIPDLPHAHSFAHTSSYTFPPTSAHSYSQPAPRANWSQPAVLATQAYHPYFTPVVKAEVEQESQYDGVSDSSPPSMPRRVKAEDSDDVMSDHPHHSAATSTTSGGTPANPSNIQIRTKFPVARIKRIMQADDDVGKVAQVTPVAVNKALELFMIGLVTASAQKARDGGSKRVGALHLKSVIEGEEKWDFLGEIVARVQEGEKEGRGRKRKEESSSEGEEDEKPKKSKGKGRRKKGDD